MKQEQYPDPEGEGVSNGILQDVRRATKGTSRYQVECLRGLLLHIFLWRYSQGFSLGQTCLKIVKVTIKTSCNAPEAVVLALEIRRTPFSLSREDSSLSLKREVFFQSFSGCLKSESRPLQSTRN